MWESCCNKVWASLHNKGRFCDYKRRLSSFLCEYGR